MTFNTYARNDETRKYVKRIKNVGKTLDAFSVLDIDNFVTGCKDLGVWNNMVCWPLRSSQNTGTNTAFSLGGLGKYDGTLVNGPTWGVDGIIFDGSNDFINTNFTPSATDNVTMFAVGKRTSGASGDFFSQLQQLTLVSRNDGGPSIGFLDPTFRYTLQGQIAINEMASLAFQKLNGQGPLCFKNGNLSEQFSLSGALPTPTEPLLIACRQLASPTLFLTGSIPFALYHNDMTANTTSLYNLYKSTLGKGLGLP